VSKTIMLISAVVAMMTPLIAEADLKKCVSGTGAITFTDQPCPSKPGEVLHEVSNDVAIKKITVQQKDKDAGRVCWELSHRYSQCNTSVDHLLMVNFKEICTMPINRFISERQRDIMRNRVSREEPEANDLEFVHRFTRKSRAVLQCESLQQDMWNFLKSNFSGNIPEQDKKAIDYKLQAAPTEGRMPVTPVRR